MWPAAKRGPLTSVPSTLNWRSTSRLPADVLWRQPKRNREPEGSRDAATQQRIRSPLGGRNSAVVVARVAQHVASAPYGFDVVLTAGGRLQLLAQLADEHVDDLQLRLVHATVEMV